MAEKPSRKRQPVKEVKAAVAASRAPRVSRGVAFLPTGATLLDLVVGAGRGAGLETGMLITFPGKSSGGKTFVACEIIAQAKNKYQEKLKHIFDDCESGFTFNTEELYGFEIMPFDPKKRTRSKTVEQALGNIRAFLKTLGPGEFGIYVLDSLDGLMDEKGSDRANARQEAFEKGKEFDEESYNMSKQKFLSNEFFPILGEEAEKHNCLIIITQQLRDNVGATGYQKKDKVSGGRAAFFYSHIQLWTQSAFPIMGFGGRQIGNVIKLWTEKAKGPRPFRECFIPLYYDYGLDDVAANVDFYWELRTDKGDLKQIASDKAKKPLELKWAHDVNDPEKDIIVGDRQQMIDFIEEHNLEDELKRRVIRCWEEIEAKAVEVISHRKKKFEKKVEESGGPAENVEPETVRISKSLLDEPHEGVNAHAMSSVNEERSGSEAAVDADLDKL